MSVRHSGPAALAKRRDLQDELQAKQEEARKTKREVEELRKQYGPDWLQASPSFVFQPF